MSPIRSSLARSVSKLLGVYRNNDLSLRGTTIVNKAVIPITAVLQATGGTDFITPAPNGPSGETRYYKHHAFTNSSSTENFVVTALDSSTGFPASVEYYIIGGGGGGGTNEHTSGSGGGAGGFLGGSFTATVNPGYTIRVGAGGATDNNGTPSYIDGPNISQTTAWGGGKGGPNASAGTPGGSGGGAGGNDGPQRAGGVGNKQTGTGTDTGSSPPQGFPGGVGSGTGGGADNMAGGGGGAGQAGENGSGPGGPGAPRAGGYGKAVPWSLPSDYGAPGPDGALRYFSGGGGGSGHPNNGGALGAGGYGGGAGAGNAAVANTGGGGAGPLASAAGIVLFRYFYNSDTNIPD